VVRKRLPLGLGPARTAVGVTGDSARRTVHPVENGAAGEPIERCLRAFRLTTGAGPVLPPLHVQNRDSTSAFAGPPVCAELLKYERFQAVRRNSKPYSQCEGRAFESLRLHFFDPKRRLTWAALVSTRTIGVGQGRRRADEAAASPWGRARVDSHRDGNRIF
jgi:hypothetical protein